MSERTTVALLGLAVGCAQIHASEVSTDAPMSPTIEHQRIENSTAYEAIAAIRGEAIHLDVEQWERCAEITTPRVHRTTAVTRTADRTTTSATWGVGVTAIGVGVYNYSDPSTAGSDYRAVTPALAVVGFAVLAIAVVDALRATDYERDDGVVAGTPQHVESICRHHTSRDQEVVLLLANGYSLFATLDANGRAEFAAVEVPDAGLPDDTSTIVATIGTYHLEVQLSISQRAELRRELLADPKSRLASDRLEQRHAGCEQVVSATRESRPEDAPSAAQLGWRAAKDTCKDLWTAELETELEAAKHRIEEALCNQRFVQTASDLSGEASPSVEDLTTEFVDLRTHCGSDERKPQLAKLDAALTAVVRRKAKEAAAKQRRIAQQQAAEAREARRQQQASQLQQSWGSAMLLCNDGSLSPSCTCGRGSYQGCCSHHQGVNRCSAGDP
jgi:hypothetical protein